MGELFDTRHAKSTKKNTAWGMKIFQDWNIEMSGRPLDMVEVSVPGLAEELRKFYFGARPNKGNDEVYHSNTLINIRGAINRYLVDIHRNIDIVRDKEFKHANGVLDGLLKQRKKSELSKPSTHKPVIKATDLHKMFTYLESAGSSPIILRQCVWFNLSIHFVTRGMEFHQELTRNALIFHQDETGEYVKIARNPQQESVNDKRMYSLPDSPSCPVKMLKLLLEKTDVNATQLFNQYKKEACVSPVTTNVWYTAKPLSKRTFARFLSDVCKAANVEENYTPLCLRSTAIQCLNNAGFEAHALSVRPYNRAGYWRRKKALDITSFSPMTATTPVQSPSEVRMAVSHPGQAINETFRPSDTLTQSSNNPVNASPPAILCPHPDSVQVRHLKIPISTSNTFS